MQWHGPSTLNVVQFKRPVLPELYAFLSAVAYRYGLQWNRPSTMSVVQFQTPSTGLRHPSFKEVPESDARSVVQVKSPVLLEMEAFPSAVGQA